MRPVKARVWDIKAKEWKEVIGVFHQWGNSFDEYEAGPGNFTVAIVELPDGIIITPLANEVKFIDK